MDTIDADDDCGGRSTAAENNKSLAEAINDDKENHKNEDATEIWLSEAVAAAANVDFASNTAFHTPVSRVSDAINRPDSYSDLLDEESRLVTPEEASSSREEDFQPPFSAPLVPIVDSKVFVERLKEQLKQQQDEELKYHGSRNKTRNNNPKLKSSFKKSQKQFKSTEEIATTAFIESERGGKEDNDDDDYDRDDIISLEEKSSRRVPEKYKNKINKYSFAGITDNFDESEQYNDGHLETSTTSTLLLPDEINCNSSAEHLHENTNHQFRNNYSEHLNHNHFNKNNNNNNNSRENNLKKLNLRNFHNNLQYSSIVGNSTKTPLMPMTTDEQNSQTIVTENLNDENDCSCPKEFYQRKEINYSLFFDDGIRSIDFVLAYKVNPQPQQEADNEEKRRVFEENLINQGLEIEHVYKEKEEVHFVKIHAPLEVLRRYTEILKLRMPMKEIPGMSVVTSSTRSVFSRVKGVFSFFMRHIFVDTRHFPIVTHRFTAIYSRDKEYLFDIRQDCFFTTAVRSRIVQFILDRQRFPTKYKDEMAFGIERLIEENVYCAAYPLHDGEITEEGTMRATLYEHWASVGKWYRYQPLDYVKEYFGVKIGLYFAWLGYYTYMLLLASIIGLICFTYSWVSLKNYVPVKEVCDRDPTHSITMCPLCDWCNFWDLRETCFYAKITYLIDNPSTVFFAVFMSFWATLFLELWKRYSAEITHRWDLTGFDVHEEHPRPQYLARLQHIPPTRTDYVTNMKEPTVPFWRMKLPATVLSFSVVLLLIALAFAALIAVVVYRMSMLAALKVGSSKMTTSSAIVLATASAAFVNLCLLYVLNYIYNILAEYLTELELWRTQTQFDDSLTLKIYLLQFVNYYASIFYIAFFKGKFVGRPGKYNTFFDYRQEECSAGGCLTELCIQLAIIMVGKQAFNSALELVMPIIWRRVMALKNGLYRLFSQKNREVKKEKIERWLRDLKLLDWGSRSLFPEYLEMVLQYGFVTIFVAAFPLAPFFALINNILEMRLDAKKLLTHHRRPVSQRVRDIGVWYRILDCIGKLSVITNGFIIAFTSDLIPRLVYRAIASKDKSLNGYLNFTLSDFRINDSDTLRSLAGDHTNLTTCKYSDYREPPDSPFRYELNNMFYIILACRLGFVVVFENFVALVMILVRWCIPDMSVELRDQIRREIYITNEIIIEQEARRARTERAKRSSSMRLSENRSSISADAVDNENSLKPVHENDKFIKIEKLLSSNHLSQSQMDLIIHGNDSTTGISGTN